MKKDEKNTQEKKKKKKNKDRKMRKQREGEEGGPTYAEVDCYKGACPAYTGATVDEGGKLTLIITLHLGMG